jgi:hypothetical protein
MSRRDADLHRVLQVLTQRVSEINARVMCERARRVLRNATRIEAHEWPLYVTKLQCTAGPGRIEHQIAKAPGTRLELDPLPGAPPKLRIVANGESQEVTLI